jgi:hypothetical protein
MTSAACIISWLAMMITYRELFHFFFKKKKIP